MNAVYHSPDLPDQTTIADFTDAADHLVRERGYGGGQPHLQRLLAGWRRAEDQAKDAAVEHQILEPVRDPETGQAISPVIAAALCIKPRGKLTPDQARKVGVLNAGSPAFATMRSQARALIIPNAQGCTMKPSTDVWIDPTSTLITDKNQSN